jgi:hypothetical protein
MGYSELTDSLNSILTSEKNWVNIPGGLDKVSESSLGAVWGIKNGSLYSCLIPCNGNWVLQVFPEASPNLKILDFTTDDSLVYVLWNNPDTQITGLMTKNGNNFGEWSRAELAPNITQLFNTSSYIWGQSGTQKYKLAKPGTTSNWVLATDTSDIKITSGSPSGLYGVDSKGVAYKSDEALQSGWKVIPQFKGVFTGILGEADPTLYGISNNQIQECRGDDCKVLPIESPVKNFSPRQDNLWMTSEGQGNLGNIYMKDQTKDLINDVKPLDKQRDVIVQDTQTQYQVATYYEIMTKQLTELKKMLSNLLNVKKVDTTSLEKNLKDTQGTSEQLENALPRLLQILIILGLLIVIYLCSGILGFTTHYIAFAVFIGGIYYVLSNGM